MADPNPANQPAIGRTALTLLVGLLAALVFEKLGSPLPWLIGPLLTVAAANVSGTKLGTPLVLRNAAQLILGVAFGLYFTAQTVDRLQELWWLLLAGWTWAIVLSLAFAYALVRYAQLDKPTSFFSGVVGNASEMAIQGERLGGQVQAIATVHTVRIMLVVLTIPFIYQWFDVHGDDVYVSGQAVVYWQGLLWMLLACFGLAWTLNRWGLANSWMLGPMVFVAGLTSQGVVPSALPVSLLQLGQLLIGVSLGSRFGPDFVSRAPRLVGVTVVMVVIGGVLSALVGAALAWAGGLPVATMILATSPGGNAEMSLTAKLLQLGVPVVTSFQVSRAVLLLLISVPLYRRWSRITW